MKDMSFVGVQRLPLIGLQDRLGVVIGWRNVGIKGRHFLEGSVGLLKHTRHNNGHRSGILHQPHSVKTRRGVVGRHGRDGLRTKGGLFTGNIVGTLRLQALLDGEAPERFLEIVLHDTIAGSVLMVFRSVVLHSRTIGVHVLDEVFFLDEESLTRHGGSGRQTQDEIGREFHDRFFFFCLN